MTAAMRSKSVIQSVLYMPPHGLWKHTTKILHVIILSSALWSINSPSFKDEWVEWCYARSNSGMCHKLKPLIWSSLDPPNNEIFNTHAVHLSLNIDLKEKLCVMDMDRYGIKKPLDGAAQCKYHSQCSDWIADMLQLKSLLQLLFDHEVHRSQHNLPLTRNVLQFFFLIAIFR